MRKHLVLAFIITILGLTALRAVAGGYAISIEATPSSIPADGKSYSQLLITVTDPSGKPTPDSLEVRLASTGGTITPIAYTGGGRATGILTSATTPQVAMITASVAGMSASTDVQFVSLAEVISAAPKIVRMSAKSIAYSVERDVALGKENVRAEYRGLIIKATNIQVSEAMGVLRAQGKVHVQQGDKTVDADAFCCDLRTDHCRVLTSGDTPSVSTFDTGKLQAICKSTTPVDMSQFTPLDASGTSSWIISRRLAIFPNDKIQFFRASIYVGDAHVINMPYYAYSYQNRESILQQVRYTSRDGLVVDLPLYYQMSDSGSGAFKLRYVGANSNGGYFSSQKGVGLGFEQAYSSSDKNDGRLSIDSIFDSQRTFALSQRMDFGSFDRNARIDFGLRFQPTSDFAKNIYNSTLNVNGGLGNYDYTISGYYGGSEMRQWDYMTMTPLGYAGQSDGSIRAVIHPRQYFANPSPIRFTPSLTLGYGRLASTNPATGMNLNPSAYQSLGMGVNTKPIGSSKLNLGFDGSSAFSVAENGSSGADLRTSANLRTNWGGGSASVSYTLNLSNGPISTLYSTSKEMLSGTVSLISGGRWSCNAFAGYGLDTGQFNLSSMGSCRLFGKYSIRSIYSLYSYKYSFSGYSYKSATSYLKTGIYRALGPYDIGLAWSPDGQDFGLKRGNRVWLEVGAAGF